MSLRVYDGKSVVVTVGTFILEDVESVTPARNEDAFTLKMGVSGSGARSKTNNQSGRFMIVLMQTSPSNDLLSALHILDESTPNGDGIVPVIVKDLNGTSLHTGAHCWIVKGPDAENAAEAGDREWILETDKLISFHGGNNLPPGA